MSVPCEAKPSKDRSRLRERREAQDRRSRPRALTAADGKPLVFDKMTNEAARRHAIERGRHVVYQFGYACKEAEE